MGDELTAENILARALPRLDAYQGDVLNYFSGLLPITAAEHGLSLDEAVEGIVRILRSGDFFGEPGDAWSLFVKAEQLKEPLGFVDRVERLLGRCYYDRDGKPIGLGEWSRLFHDHDLNLVRWECIAIAGGRLSCIVSTRFVGLDLTGDAHERPGIYQTLIQRGQHAGRSWCYASREAARRGHAEILQSLEQTCAPPDESPAFA